MTKVCFDTSALASGHAVRGIGFYTKHLLEHMKPLADDFGIEIVQNAKICNLIHYPYLDLFRHTLPITKKSKTVVTIHDVIPLEFPDHYPQGIRGWVNLQLQKLALSEVEGVITVSQASIMSIRKYLDVPHEKIKLVYEAADEKFKKIKKPKNKFDLPPKFVLYVGDVNWNKNIPNLIKACEQISYPLVIVGKQALEISNLKSQIPMKISNPQNLIRKILGRPHPQLKHLELLEKLFENNEVIRLGFVSDYDLVNIYNLATVYCQPSFAEGFGLPVLEALACGTAVACSQTSSLPEIAGLAASYFDPYNIDSLVNALKTAKSKDGPSQSEKFSWDKAAKQTLQVYTEVIHSV